MTSTIIDLIIRIKNGYLAGKNDIQGSYSRLNENVLALLKKESYIKDFSVVEVDKKKDITIQLLYNDNKPAVTGIKILSKPGRRTYRRLKDMRPVLGGLGIAIISTSQGVITDKQARENKKGGEILFQIW